MHHGKRPEKSVHSLTHPDLIGTGLAGVSKGKLDAYCLNGLTHYNLLLMWFWFSNITRKIFTEHSLKLSLSCFFFLNILFSFVFLIPLLPCLLLSMFDFL